MSNQEEKKCERCGGTGFIEIQGKTLECLDCKLSEVKQEPEEKSECCNNPMKYDGGVGYCTDCRLPCDPTTNIKTPEEIARNIVDSWYPLPDKTGTWMIGKEQADEIAPIIAQAISAERNANLEKIKELEEQVALWGADKQSYVRKNLELESKLAEAVELNKTLNYLNSCKDGKEYLAVLQANFKLEAEAKAVRDNLKKYGHHLFLCTKRKNRALENDDEVGFNECHCGLDRALNSGKEV